jgi:hypothetical protein
VGRISSSPAFPADLLLAWARSSTSIASAFSPRCPRCGASRSGWPAARGGPATRHCGSAPARHPVERVRVGHAEVSTPTAHRDRELGGRHLGRPVQPADGLIGPPWGAILTCSARRGLRAARSARCGSSPRSCAATSGRTS